jgi:hypothetical protein
MRRLAYKDINKSLIVGMKFTTADLKQRGHTIHKWSKDTLHELKKAKGNF